jgi:mannose-1-phosphate guanylyltransferase
VLSVILAGGFGTRMRPLTLHRPKPLLPLMNEPMLDRLVRGMPGEVDRVVLAVNYMADAIRAHLGEVDLGVRVEVVEEAEPLGTGGAFRNALGDSLGDEAFLGMNGDVVASLDMGEMLRAHDAHGGAGTIALWPVDDPSAFGVVETGADGRIVSFQEKPPRGQERSNLINAGAYVLRADLLGSIEKGKPASIERDVFPRVLDRGLYGHRFGGFWLDAGTPQAYLQAHRELLWRRMPRRPRSLEAPRTARVLRPCLFGRGVRLGAGCEVGPYAVLGDGCTVAQGAHVTDSVLLPRASVGARASVVRCILGEGASVVDGGRVEDAIVEDGKQA